MQCGCLIINGVVLKHSDVTRLLPRCGFAFKCFVFGRGDCGQTGGLFGQGMERTRQTTFPERVRGSVLRDVWPVVRRGFSTCAAVQELCHYVVYHGGTLCGDGCNGGKGPVTWSGERKCNFVMAFALKRAAYTGRICFRAGWMYCLPAAVVICIMSAFRASESIVS